MMKIGLFGGSFDPVHNGHILLAKKALKQLKLNFLFFIPAYIPPHKSRKLINAVHRKKMVQFAIKGCKNFLISDFELKRKTKTYTYQTINYFHKKYPKSEIYFIVGSDSAIDLENWKNPENIIKTGRVVVGDRKGYCFNRKMDFVKLSGKIADISATEIRSKIKNGCSLKGLVPPAVERYIKENGLYR